MAYLTFPICKGPVLPRLPQGESQFRLIEELITDLLVSATTNKKANNQLDVATLPAECSLM